jgi:thioredoxin 1
MIIQLKQSTTREANKPMVIKAFATWCSHCAVMKPLFEQLSRELGDKYLFAEFDVDASPELTHQFNVASLPTFIFVKDKKEVGRITGEMAQADLKENIENYLG